MKYAFYIPTSHSGGEGKGNTDSNGRENKQTNLIRYTYRPTKIETTNTIGLRSSCGFVGIW